VETSLAPKHHCHSFKDLIFIFGTKKQKSVINFNIKEIHTDFLRKIIGYIRCTGGDL
jgi:mRNA-degrading endonuclease YafQ of YafQ-DinJ toxin-antitoxin module